MLKAEVQKYVKGELRVEINPAIIKKLSQWMVTIWVVLRSLGRTSSCRDKAGMVFQDGGNIMVAAWKQEGNRTCLEKDTLWLDVKDTTMEVR